MRVFFFLALSWPFLKKIVFNIIMDIWQILEFSSSANLHKHLMPIIVDSPHLSFFTHFFFYSFLSFVFLIWVNDRSNVRVRESNCGYQLDDKIE